MTEREHIVVGVDGSPAGKRALRWAVREAARRGHEVRAVIAWRWDIAENTDTISSDAADDAAWTVNREVHNLAAEERGQVQVSTYVIEGRPAEVLTKAATHAEFLVIGSHGHSHRLHEVLGSVAEECIRNATCPVVVLPPRLVA
jgi:nucleotide-binding universal stress UspA family protein